MVEFNQWKEREEELMHTSYVSGDRTYQPKMVVRIKWLCTGMYSYMQMCTQDTILCAVEMAATEETIILGD